MRIIVYLFVFFLPVQIQAKKESILITQITTFLSKVDEKIILETNNPIQNDPTLTYEEGIVRFFFYNTTFEDQLKYKRVNDRFIRAIRSIKDNQGTLIEISFSNPSFTAQNKVDYSKKKNTFNITIKVQELDNAKSDEEFFPESRNETPKDTLAEESVTFSFAKMLFALAFVLAILYFLLWLYQKYILNRFKNPSKDHRLKILSSYHLGPKQKIIILDINQRNFLCGVSPNHVGLISEIEPWERLRWKKYLTSNQNHLDIAMVRREFEKQKQSVEQPKKETNENTLKPKRFGDELISKIRNMREID